MATVWLPGSPLAYPGLPTDIQLPFQRVLYAIERASNPRDVLPFLVQPSPAAHAVYQWGSGRGKIATETLTAFADHFSHQSQGSGFSDVLPLHDTIAMVIDAAKMLMEMEAGTILMWQTVGQPGQWKTPPWVSSLDRVATSMRNVGYAGETITDSIAAGCCNLVSSMFRLIQGWDASVGDSAMPPPPMVPFNGADAAVQTPMPEPQYIDHIPAHLPPSTLEMIGSRQMQAHQAYMDTSDRWMAGQDQHPPYSQPMPNMAPGQPPQYPMGGVDQLLSQMLSYPGSTQHPIPQIAQQTIGPHADGLMAWAPTRQGYMVQMNGQG